MFSCRCRLIYLAFFYFQSCHLKSVQWYCLYHSYKTTKKHTNEGTYHETPAKMCNSSSKPEVTQTRKRNRNIFEYFWFTFKEMEWGGGGGWGQIRTLTHYSYQLPKARLLLFSSGGQVRLVVWFMMRPVAYYWYSRSAHASLRQPPCERSVHSWPYLVITITIPSERKKRTLNWVVIVFALNAFARMEYFLHKYARIRALVEKFQMIVVVATKYWAVGTERMRAGKIKRRKNIILE